MPVSRESLVDHRTSLPQTAEDVGGREQKRLERVDNRVDREFPKLDAAIEAHIWSDADLTKRYDILQSIPGLGRDALLLNSGVGYHLQPPGRQPFRVRPVQQG